MKFYKKAFIIFYFFTSSFLSSMERFTIACKDGSLLLEGKTYKFMQSFLGYPWKNAPVTKKDLLSFLTSFPSHVETFKIDKVAEALAAAHSLNIDSKEFFLVNWLIEYYKKKPFVQHTNKTGLSIKKLGLELTTKILKKFFHAHTQYEIDDKSSQLLADTLQKSEYCWPWVSMDNTIQVMALYPNKDYATITLQKGKPLRKESFREVNVTALRDSQFLNGCRDEFSKKIALFQGRNSISLPITKNDFEEVINKYNYIDPSKNIAFLNQALNAYYRLDAFEKMEELMICLENMINNEDYHSFSFSKKDFISDSLFRWILVRLIKHQTAKNSTDETQNNYDLVLESLNAPDISFYGGHGKLRVYFDNKKYFTF